MARGKHARAVQRRRDIAVAARRDRLRRELAEETARHTEAGKRLGDVAAARVALHQETAATRRRLSSVERRAEHKSHDAFAVLDSLREARVELGRAAESLNTGSRIDLDSAIRAGHKLALKNVHRNASPAFREQHIRRRFRDLELTKQLVLEGWVPPATSTEKRDLEPFVFSRAGDTSPEAMWVWSIPPWLRHPDGTDAPELRADLGATTSGGLDWPCPVVPGLELRSTATITSSWRHTPLISQPQDAADLAFWYTRSAAGQGWGPLQPPVPFWLPTEHAVSFPQARSLPPEAAIRLPFPYLYAAFATPWELPVRAFPGHDEQWPFSEMLHARPAAAGSARPENLQAVMMRLHGIIPERDVLPTPLEAVAACTTTVEGLLLTAEPDGTPTDTFAWCLCIHHGGGLPLARVTVPASRTGTRWRKAIDNTIAGIALSTWHQPLPAHDTRELGRTSGTAEPLPADLHILDIDSTTSTARSRDHGGPTSGCRPHLRRGHWRRQRVGRGRAERRWTWVRPSAVHGHTALDQVYVLPR